MPSVQANPYLGLEVGILAATPLGRGPLLRHGRSETTGFDSALIICSTMAPRGATSATGHKLTLAVPATDVRFGSKAEILQPSMRRPPCSRKRTFMGLPAQRLNRSTVSVCGRHLVPRQTGAIDGLL